MEQQITVNDTAMAFKAEAFDSLPEILKSYITLFNHNIEREVLLVGSLGVLSGCLPNIVGLYDTRKVGCNLYVFIQAQAGAGKGTLIYAKLLAQIIHTDKLNRSKEACNEYKELMAEHRSNKKKKKGETTEPSLEPPKQEMLFIPANSSSSAFLTALANNNGKGILFCTEADTLVGTLKQDWGNYSDSMRCAFHHEPITQLRKINNEFIEIQKPCLSVVLSGTPGQLRKLIPNAENGLFSRFCYYDLKLTLEWKDIFTSNGIDYEQALESTGKKICSLYERLDSLEIPIVFRFTTEQQQVFNQSFERWQRELSNIYGNDIVPSVRRLGLIYFRLAMLLSALRLIDLPVLPLEIVCNSIDYHVAGLLTETFISNMTSIILDLPADNMALFNDKRKNALYEMLPADFSRDLAIDNAKKVGVSPATVDRLLKEKEMFIKTSYGNYKKVL